jgi:uncharacterized protein DUF4252
MRATLWCAIFGLAGVLACAAQTIKVPESWDRLAAKADEVVNVTMDRKMLQFASKFMDQEGDQEGKQLVSKLNGIYVRSLQFKKPGAFAEADVESLRAQLQGPEWSRLVQVDSKSAKQKVEIYVKTVGDQTMGMVILALEPTELTFVDLDGPINPEQIGELGGNFGIPKDVHVQPKKAAAPQSLTPPSTVKK